MIDAAAAAVALRAFGSRYSPRHTMPTDHRHAAASLARLLVANSADYLAKRLAPKPGTPYERFPGGTAVDAEALDRRWRALTTGADARAALLDPLTLADAEGYRHNVEGFIGTVKTPVGIAGPLLVNGTSASGMYHVPLATTEAALVASYSRGALLITEAGGCAAVLVNDGVTRAPAFAFASLHEAGQFIAWTLEHMDAIRSAAESTTRHGKLKDMRVTLEGNHVYLIFEYTTGDAAGQNMVTIATQAICEHIIAECPITPRAWYVEGNHSGDKKASAQSFLSVRGRSVTAEVRVPGALIEQRLHTTAQALADYWRVSAVGGVLSGTIGVQGHYANGLAALYLACGQDVACVAESAVGVTRFELDEGDLYASVTLPNLIVGTVGGGTRLPSQHACLGILGVAGDGGANAFAEVAAAISLAGELSIVGALVANEFTKAHARLARRKGAETR